MEVSKTKLDGVLLIKPPTIFEDFRGTYVETYNEKLYYEAGIKIKFIQDDISVSSQNVLRGIHGDATTWKLVSCLYGEFYLVVVNWDKASPGSVSGNPSSCPTGTGCRCWSRPSSATATSSLASWPSFTTNRIPTMTAPASLPSHGTTPSLISSGPSRTRYYQREMRVTKMFSCAKRLIDITKAGKLQGRLL